MKDRKRGTLVLLFEAYLALNGNIPISTRNTIVEQRQNGNWIGLIDTIERLRNNTLHQENVKNVLVSYLLDLQEQQEIANKFTEQFVDISNLGEDSEPEVEKLHDEILDEPNTGLDIKVKEVEDEIEILEDDTFETEMSKYLDNKQLSTKEQIENNEDLKHWLPIGHEVLVDSEGSVFAFLLTDKLQKKYPEFKKEQIGEYVHIDLKLENQ